MADTLTEEQKEEINEAFKLFDKNGDGCLTEDEITNVVRVIGMNPTKDDIARMMSQVDKNENGKIELDEFTAMMAPHMNDPINDEASILEAFDVFDKNNDGYIVASEIKQVLTGLGDVLSDDEVNSILAKADTDKDGRISYKEFTSMMTEKPCLT